MDRLAHIFERQAAYLETLKPIYLANGFVLHASKWPLNFQGQHEQEEFRLLAWRYTEELFEAMECYESGSPPADYHEEMADALHFLVELCLATGIRYTALTSGFEDVTIDADESDDSLDFVFKQVKKDPIYSQRWFGSIRSLGLGMMSLRQRPWRRDSRESNRAQFVLMMQATFYSFVNVCIRTGITAQELHNAYFAKAKINHQRTVVQKDYCEHGLPRQFCTAAKHRGEEGHGT